jgi:hypothetical protein
MTLLETRRQNRTIQYLKDHSPSKRILDLGVESQMSNRMILEGYQVTNTPLGLDLDTDFHRIDFDRWPVVTAFEIFEHLFSPFNILGHIPSGKILIATVPINVWFSPPHWSNSDRLDCHYHEFYPKQFDHLLRRTGWEKIHSEEWTISGLHGIRPMLRLFHPSYYAVVAIKP